MATAMPPVAVVTSAEIVTTPPSIGEADRVTVVKGDNRIPAAGTPGICNWGTVMARNAITSMTIEWGLRARDTLAVTSAPARFAPIHTLVTASALLAAFTPGPPPASILGVVAESAP